MANRIISKEINLNNSSNKYITEINNNGIQIHEPGYNVGNYDKNITLNSNGIQLNCGNIPLMNLDHDSLDFFKVDLENNTSKEIANFTSDGIIFKNEVNEGTEQTPEIVEYTTLLSDGLYLTRDDDTIAEFSNNGVTIGSQNSTNINMSSGSFSINEGGIQYASFSSNQLLLNTSEGTPAFEIIADNDSTESVTRKLSYDKLFSFPKGTVIDGDGYKTATMSIMNISPSSAPYTFLFCSQPSKDSDAVSNTLTSYELNKATLLNISGVSWSRILTSYTSGSRVFKLILALKRPTTTITRWQAKVYFQVDNTSSADYTLQNTWYAWFDSISVTSIEKVPKNILYGSTLARSYRTLDDGIISSYIIISGTDSTLNLQKEVRQKVPTSNCTRLYGNAFSYNSTTQSIKMDKSGLILVWANIRIGEGFSSAAAVYGRTVAQYSNLVEPLKSSRMRCSGTVNSDMVIPPRVTVVDVGDEIYLDIMNNNNSYGNIIPSSCALCALYLGPKMADRV